MSLKDLSDCRPFLKRDRKKERSVCTESAILVCLPKKDGEMCMSVTQCVCFGKLFGYTNEVKEG